MKHFEETIEKVNNLMRENNLHGDVYEACGILCIEVNWGDWKHDHWRLVWLMQENFDIKQYRVEPTEEDGSDCYSAIHKYVI